MSHNQQCSSTEGTKVIVKKRQLTIKYALTLLTVKRRSVSFIVVICGTAGIIFHVYVQVGFARTAQWSSILLGFNPVRSSFTDIIIIIPSIGVNFQKN